MRGLHVLAVLAALFAPVSAMAESDGGPGNTYTALLAAPEPVARVAPRPAAVASAASSTSICPEQKSAQVDVRWRSEPVKYDTSQSFAELGARHIDTKNPYGTHVTVDVGGLMTGKITYRTGTEIASVTFPATHTTCLWITKVVVDIVMDPVIQIASEHTRGSCKYIAVLEHESKHVVIDRAIVAKHLQPVRAAASEAVQRVGVVGPKPHDTEESYKAKMSGFVQKSVKEVMDEMYAERIKQQQALDTREEYDRVDAMCPREAGR